MKINRKFNGVYKEGILKKIANYFMNATNSIFRGIENKFDEISGAVGKWELKEAQNYMIQWSDEASNKMLSSITRKLSNEEIHNLKNNPVKLGDMSLILGQWVFIPSGPQITRTKSEFSNHPHDIDGIIDEGYERRKMAGLGIENLLENIQNVENSSEIINKEE